MFRFTLTDYTTNPLGNSLLVEEPGGWENLAMRLKRDKLWHGFFDFFDDALTGLQFDDDGYSLLKDAYERKGVDAYVDILIEYQCGDSDTFAPLYTGKFNFGRNYNEICGDRCYIEAGIDSTSCMVLFKNRYDQKVDLDSKIPFEKICNLTTRNVLGGFNPDGNIITVNYDLNGVEVGDIITITNSDTNNGTYTVLEVFAGESSTSIHVAEDVTLEFPSNFTINGCLTLMEMEEYEWLNKPVILPTKPIEFNNYWKIANYVLSYTDDALDSQVYSTPGAYFFNLDWHDSILTEIDESDTLPNITTYVNPTNPRDFMVADNAGMIEFKLPAGVVCYGTVDIDIILKGNIELNSNDTIKLDANWFILHTDRNGLAKYSHNLDVNYGCAGCNLINESFDINYSHTLNIMPEDRIYLYLQFANVQYLSGGGGGGPSDPFELTLNITEGSFKAKFLSKCEPTPARVYMVNETMSRIVEAYTGDCLRVKSNYYGRTDSQPYASAEDGCGGLRVVTSGLKIRARETDKVFIGGQPNTPRLTLSMKDMFDAMNAVDNIGLGIEPDTERIGYHWLRVEPVNHFYNTSVVLTCDHIAEVKRKINPEALFSIFKCGYEKWESERVNGLNDVFTKREYRTMLTTIRNTYDRVCKFIASDYTIEVTRREYGTTTKDWKYDNDTFIICLTNTLRVKATFLSPKNITITDLGYDLNDYLHPGDQIKVVGSAGNDATYTIDYFNSNSIVTSIWLLETVTFEAPVTVHLANLTNPFRLVQQNNVVSSSNILYPEYCYNLEISPARNALRHFITLLMSYRDFIEGIVKFTNGDGNYLAQTELDNVNGCLLEAGACLDDSGSGDGEGGSEKLPENGDMNVKKFVCDNPDLTAFRPLYRPELVEYDLDITYAEYLAIAANPYGIIEFQCGDGPMEQGWIEDFKYKPAQGMAEFTLKPRIQYV